MLNDLSSLPPLPNLSPVEIMEEVWAKVLSSAFKHYLLLEIMDKGIRMGYKTLEILQSKRSFYVETSKLEGDYFWPLNEISSL